MCFLIQLLPSVAFILPPTRYHIHKNRFPWPIENELGFGGHFSSTYLRVILDTESRTDQFRREMQSRA